MKMVQKNNDINEIEYTFEIIKNDIYKFDKNLAIKLVKIKNIFAKQLPKMPKEYITRLVMDYRHETIVIKDEDNNIFGGLCFREFEERKLCEIVFLAVMHEKQIKGFGSKIMNQLKQEMQKRGNNFLMTCADNLATGYFKKQGFHEEILIPNHIYKGFLKDYESSTLMECLLEKKFFDYNQINQIIKNKKKELINKILEKNNINKEYKGISENQWNNLLNENKKNKFSTLVNINLIPGLEDYNIEEYQELEAIPKSSSFQESCKNILNQFKNLKKIEPFLNPVKREEVPDYYDIIEYPMDFTTMSNKLKNGLYKVKNDFIEDINLIIKNAKLYNSKDTLYYKYAINLEEQSKEILKNLKEEFIDQY